MPRSSASSFGLFSRFWTSVSFFFHSVALERPPFLGQVTRILMLLSTPLLGLCQVSRIFALELGIHRESAISCIPWISFPVVGSIWLRHMPPGRNKAWCKAISVRFRHVRIATSAVVWAPQPRFGQDLNMLDRGLEFSILEIAISARCHLFGLTGSTIVVGSC